jgi:hypothetical protein
MGLWCNGSMKIQNNESCKIRKGVLMDTVTKIYIFQIVILGIIFVVAEYEYAKKNNPRGNIFGIAAIALIGLVTTFIALIQHLMKG